MISCDVHAAQKFKVESKGGRRNAFIFAQEPGSQQSSALWAGRVRDVLLRSYGSYGYGSHGCAVAELCLWYLLDLVWDAEPSLLRVGNLG